MIEEQIDCIMKGNTLSEVDMKFLCEKVFKL